MSEELEVTIFELPDRFLVSCRSKDDEYRKFYKGMEDFDPYAPYLVDLSELESGWCACREFTVYIWPALGTTEQKRTQCAHLLAAAKFKQGLAESPRRQLPRLSI